MLFYFTATGNSLYVAKKLDANPISIPQALRNDNLSFEDETIGIVCPLYGHVPPQMVQNFMKKASFKTYYLYIILTYGNRHGGAAELTNQITKECGLNVNYINSIMMVDNFLPAFDMDEEKRVDKKVDEQLARILDDVDARKSEIRAATENDRQTHAVFLAGMAAMPAGAFSEMYRITEACIGCGICKKVCPDGYFRMDNGKAARREGSCQLCMACTHSCPQMAIKLTMLEKNPNARYRNENISLQEIIRANNQYS